MNRDELVKIVRDAGIVGCGGAGFPTHVKVNASAEVVIANGASCEPLLHSDIHLLEHEAGGVVRGLRYVMDAVGAKRGVIAIKKKHPEAISAVERVLTTGIEIFTLEDFYPAGDEQVLVYEIMGKIVPEGGIPLNVGAVVDNIETLFNITRAVDGFPVTHRWLTVAGAVRKPRVMLAPVGAPLSEILALAGGATVTSAGYIEGGPMMGKIIDIETAVVKKTTTGLLVFPADHVIFTRREMSIEAIIRRGMSACTQCTYCTDMCPRYLIGHRLRPNLTMRSVAFSHFDPEGPASDALICCECGVCETTACNLGLSPMRVNMMLKKRYAEEGVKFKRTETALEVHPFRYARLTPIKNIMQRGDMLEWYGQKLSDVTELFTQRVEVPLSQHIGAPCEAIVAPGAKVKLFEMIGKPSDGKLGAPVHSPIDGTVKDITDGRITIEAK